MSEIFYILTVVFVAYSVFSVLKDEKKPAQSPDSDDIKPQTPTEESAPDTGVTEDEHAHTDSIRNPETGETAKISNNYRFCKRWIKDVLVKEGLLDKVYKNNELTDDVNAKIQQALADLQMIEKYQV
ncbi:MAG: hypothetical protein KAG10_04015 [Methylococcales bacterium]|nr:hypothetical protein [Methylococcales bacterium]MCK5925037.1 hypothetical protein [Methylococcales bacterium]